MGIPVKMHSSGLETRPFGRGCSRYCTVALFAVFAGLFLVKGLRGEGGDAGGLMGHVQGPGGVSVPGATVILTNPQSGERKATWTDKAGNYVFNGLPPGNYMLEVSQVGFQTDLREPIPVSEGKTLKVNVALLISTPELAKSSGASHPASGQRLPQNLQNLAAPRQAATAGQGMEPTQMAGMNGSGNGGGVRFSDEQSAAGGTPSENPVDADTSASASNSFLLTGGEGISAATPGGDQNLRQRFMEFMPPGPGGPGFGGGGPGGGGPGGGLGGGGFGGGGGGFGGGGFGGGPPMEMLGMGGGGPGNWARGRARVNRLRGNLSEQYTNSVLDARPYPLNVAQSPRIPSYSEQLAATTGGPLVIPKLHNGGNKTSFFVNYGKPHARITHCNQSYLTILPRPSRSGTARVKNERYSPSRPRRSRAPYSNGLPVVSDARHFSRTRLRSSG
jgi:hypothetical protein